MNALDAICCISASLLVGFLLSADLFGAFSPFFYPIASAILVKTISKGFHPFYFAILFGLGGTLGELITYFIAYSSRLILERKIRLKRKIRKKLDSLKKKLGSWIEFTAEILVFIFAATPLPDDLVFFYLGFQKFPVTKLFLPCWAGKFLLGFAYGGLIKKAMAYLAIEKIFLIGIGIGLIPLLLVFLKLKLK